MKSLALKITPLLFGLFIVGVSFGSFPDTAQACYMVYGSAPCSQYAGQYDVPAGYTSGTYSYSYNSCIGTVTGSGCSAPPSCYMVYGSAPCSQYAGQYDVPA